MEKKSIFENIQIILTFLVLFNIKNYLVQYISGLRIVGRWAPGIATIFTQDSSFWK